MIRITECPRDAMQGIRQMIPARLKASYLNQLLKVGFDVIDFGSFVSPKSIPQMSDTAQVLKMLDLSETKSKLLAIVANVRGAHDACGHQEIGYLGYPFSISETFQRRNANSSIAESLARVLEISDLARQAGKQLRVYISMAFGNPYGDAWSGDIAVKWCKELFSAGITTIALADTVGNSTPATIHELFSAVSLALPEADLIAHLHSTPNQALEKVRAAYDSGCRSFDVAIHGFGGCPMAADELTGNIATEILESMIVEKNLKHRLNKSELDKSYEEAWLVFNKYH
jgi:hydroxymethylglutaryl-CoA lyase